MTVADKKRHYQNHLGQLRASRVGRLRPNDWPWRMPYKHFTNARVCRSLTLRRRDYARLTHNFLLTSGLKSVQ